MKIVRAAMLALLCWSSQATAAGLQESTDTFGPFGMLHIYQTSDQPQHLVLFISGDGGWNLGVIDMARSLAALDSMVVGIDITHYIARLNHSRNKCSYPAADFESLSQYLQKKHGFAQYTPPLLVGYSSGATMVYATLAQSPANTFAGGISLGFCPDLKTAKPLCRGSGRLAAKPDPTLGFIYNAVASLPAPWSILQGEIDQVCSTPETRQFAAGVAGADFIALPRVGHGFSVQRNWMPQFRDAFQRIVSAQTMAAAPAITDAEVKDLPLIVLPVTGKPDAMAVIVSGDGGWAGLDKQIGETLNREGIPVVGLNSLQYFWDRKTPDIAGADLTRILSHYSRQWSIGRFILIGYSRGADTLPFMVSRLPAELKSKVESVALLGMQDQIDFEFHVGDWLSGNNGEHRVVPEVEKLAGMKVACIYGADDSDSACRKLDASSFQVVEMQGGHHFGGDYRKLAAIIMEQCQR